MELLKEVFAVMRSNKLRLLLTGFAVSWGLFILIVMIGSGNGVIRGMTKSFGTDTLCTYYITSGNTSVPWHGYGQQRKISLHIADAEALAKVFKHQIRTVMMQNRSPLVDVVTEKNHLKSVLAGSQVGYCQYEEEVITQGRDFTSVDMQRHSNVCLLGQQTVDILYGRDANPIGKDIIVDGISFKIVGIYNSIKNMGSGHTIYVPFTTCQDLFAPDGTLSKIVLVANDINNEKQIEKFKDSIYIFLANQLDFSPDDKIALSCICYFDWYLQFKSVIGMFRLFIWIVGLLSLISGIVGVSNIMVTGVKERTQEFGIRIAMGASDLSIIKLVLAESVIVTLVFGYLGLLAGIVLTQGVDSFLKDAGGATYFDNPTIDFSMMMLSLLIMVISGLLAGIFPARQTIGLKLVDALNS